MRALIFNPYWQTLGGGEKYTASFCLALENKGYSVEVASSISNLLLQLKNRFDVNLKQTLINQRAEKVILTGSLWQKYWLLSKYDLVFWVSDGSLPILFGKNNILHYQVPFRISRYKIIDRIKLMLINKVICNSLFTKKTIDKMLRVESVVLYPPATLRNSQKKEKIILSVGRLDAKLNGKRHDVLVETFKRLKVKEWQLVIAGGLMGEANNLYSGDLPENVHFIVNPSYKELSELYGKAAIYWHAAGYGSDEFNSPESMEHFGISTVEAMSAAAVPVVFGGGGLKEIVDNSKNGYWRSALDELQLLTQDLMFDEIKLKTLAFAAQLKAKNFDLDQFYKKAEKLISN